MGDFINPDVFFLDTSAKSVFKVLLFNAICYLYTSFSSSCSNQIDYDSYSVRIPTFKHVRNTNYATFLQANNESSDQTKRMVRTG